MLFFLYFDNKLHFLDKISQSLNYNMDWFVCYNLDMDINFNENTEYLEQIDREEMSLIKAMDNCEDIIYRQNILAELRKLSRARIAWQFDFIFRSSLKMSIAITNVEYGKNNSYNDYLSHNINYEIGDIERECIQYGIDVYKRELICNYMGLLNLMMSFNRHNDNLYKKYIEGVDTDKIYNNRMEFYFEFLKFTAFDEDDYLNNFDKFFKSLKKKDQTILNEKYGLNGGECQSMKDVATKLNVTREDIRNAVIRFKRKYMRRH